jgi:hypothetical protein
LVQQLHKFGQLFRAFDALNVLASIEDLSDYTEENNQANFLTLLFQTGYLTVKGPEAEGYVPLGYPNREVKASFVQKLTNFVLGTGDDTPESLQTLAGSLQRGSIESFMLQLTHFYARLSYEISPFLKLTHASEAEIDQRISDDIFGGSWDAKETERHFLLLFDTLLYARDLDVHTEVKSALGSADAVVKTLNFVYVFEFKLKRDSATETVLKQSLEQIEANGYAKPYETDPNEKRKIFKIAVVFDSETRELIAWEVH